MIFEAVETLGIADVFTTVIGGLYSITTISVAIFAILGNNIQRKILGVPYISLKRYNVFMLFIPLILLTFFVLFTIWFPNLFYHRKVIWFFSCIIIGIIIIHAFLILQPIYNEKKFNNILINKKFKKSNFKSYSEIINELKDLKEQYYNKIKNNNDSYFDINDIKNIWNKYMEELSLQKDNISKDIYKELISIGFDLFKDDFIEIYNNSNLNKYLFIDYIIKNKLSDNDQVLFEYIFDQLYILYEDNFYNNENYTYCKNTLMNFFSRIINSKNLLNYLIEIVLNRNWNMIDSQYIHLYLRIIINIATNDSLLSLINLSDEKLRDKLDYVLECNKDLNNFDNRYGQNFDKFINTCFVLIRKDKEDV